MPNAPIISRALLPVCPKIEASPAKKQKESSRIQGTEDTENKSAKVACSTLVSASNPACARQEVVAKESTFR